MLKIIGCAVFILCSVSFANDVYADVDAVSVQGNSGSYRFSVTLKSIETGCEQYADWWELVSENGDLLYRRILVHSHPDTQPFTRGGGSLEISKSEIVYVRAHMNTVGYTGKMMYGSVEKGFTEVTKLPTFSKAIEKQSPLPKGCLF